MEEFPYQNDQSAIQTKIEGKYTVETSDYCNFKILFLDILKVSNQFLTQFK